MPKAIPPGGYNPGRLTTLPREMANLKDEIMTGEDTKEKSFELGTRLFRMGDDVESYTWLKDSANDGKVEAMYECGFLHYMGIGKRRERNMKQAKIWFGKAAEAGHASAQFFMGEIYEGERRHPQLAADEYAKAAAQGHTRAHFTLARLYLAGLERDKPATCDEVDKGKQHLLDAAAAGHVKAKVQLGNLYETGKGNVEPDEAEAIKWYTEAAKAGDDIAQRKIAAYFKRGAVDKCPSTWRVHLCNVGK